ncbi:hypothetical protein [Azospirillum argentinense]
MSTRTSRSAADGKAKEAEYSRTLISSGADTMSADATKISVYLPGITYLSTFRAGDDLYVVVGDGGYTQNFRVVGMTRDFLGKYRGSGVDATWQSAARSTMGNVKPQLVEKFFNGDARKGNYSVNGINYEITYEIVKTGINFTVKDFSRASKKFAENFNIRVVKTQESSQRQITDKGMLTSMTGACKDIVKTVEISPKTRNLTQDVKLDVQYTLQRFYEPYQISETGDPIRKKATYELNAANKFTVRDTVKYECVLTAGRFHAASLTLLGKLMGVDPKNSGVDTTLKKTVFSFEVVSGK